MIIPESFIYLIATIPFCVIWLLLFIKRKDLRREMLYISIFIGVLSLFTTYFWWTKDWWHPLNMTGTIIGVEDFIMGFASGGIMAVIYKTLFNGNLYIKYKGRINRIVALTPFMILLTVWLIFTIGLSSFWASVVSMLLVILLINYGRKDLIFDSFISGIAMMLISILFYLVIILLSRTWINNTYLDGLSGIRLYTIPIEEFIFWFLAGMWVGPLYEYATGRGIRHKRSK